ncbi:hypothetical protein [Metabacillus schmidteae]|uniref:hypothetical protein n=1 Tax=Metabacillus schmidteae TaxID=2730405 RepID=UPI00158EFEBB|nr:hypothetical protein [Metabacillus schmidteae]
MKNILIFLFKFCLILFLLGGTCLVFGQLAGLIFQNGDLVIKTWDIFANPTFILSAMAGVIGYILGYFPKENIAEEHIATSQEENGEMRSVQ